MTLSKDPVEETVDNPLLPCYNTGLERGWRRFPTNCSFRELPVGARRQNAGKDHSGVFPRSGFRGENGLPRYRHRPALPRAEPVLSERSSKEPLIRVVPRILIRPCSGTAAGFFIYLLRDYITGKDAFPFFIRKSDGDTHGNHVQKGCAGHELYPAGERSAGLLAGEPHL